MIIILSAFLAGLLTTLSPCVLPILPIIVGSAANKLKAAPALIAAGLMGSFTFFGVFISSVGYELGLSPSLIKTIAAGFLLFFGATMAIPAFQNLFSRVSGQLLGSLQSRAKLSDDVHWTQCLGLGAILGAVWTPCTGPTLGVAITLASSGGSSLLQATLIMFVFSIGAVLPLLAVAYGARGWMSKHQAHLLSAGGHIKKVMGVILIGVGLLILSGWDLVIERFFTAMLSDTWLDLISRF